MVASLYEHMGKDRSTPDENLLRHIVLNTMRLYVNLYKRQFSPTVLACDSKQYWRKDAFPYYKARRVLKRSESDFDWKFIFGCFDKYKQELKEYFPYRVLEIPGAEGDDIIGTLCQNAPPQEQIMIIASDHDYAQLQIMSNVHQYDPRKKELLVCLEPLEFLKEHIVIGDTGDDIPNILSDDDTFVNATKRQVAMTKDRKAHLLEDHYDHLKNYTRNRQLIDLNFIPDNIKEAILLEFETQENKSNRIAEYMREYNLRNLYEHMGEF